MHPQVDAAVARELVGARLVLPVLDGLDEIARVEHRRACVDAIDAYAERSAQHRPFVSDERAWLRISDAYEFRHRELLEHLALTPPAIE